MTLLTTLFLATSQTPELTFKQKEIRRVISERTGRNGYEEFLDAGYLVADSKFSAQIRYVEEWSREGKPPERSERPALLKSAKTVLDAYRVMAQESRVIYSLVEKGASKPVIAPSSPSLIKTEFHVSTFRDIGFLMRWAAIAEIADGHASKASKRLALGIRFGRLTSAGDEFAFVVGRTIERRMAATIEEYVDLMPANLAKDIGNLPPTSQQLAEMAKVEAAIPRRSWDDFLTAKDSVIKDVVEDEVIELRRRISSQRATQIYDSVLKNLEEPSRRMQMRLSEPESTWLDKRTNAKSVVNLGGLSPDETRVVEGYLYMWRIFSGEEGGRGEHEKLRDYVLIRIRERLLAIAADVVRYRHEHGELPATLSKIYGSEPVDPLNGKTYRIQREGAKFKVVLDVDELGVVSLSSPTSSFESKERNP